ncbi:pre-mRNA-splicing factor SLU7 [Rhizophagus irregularis]|uniref:Pre-mRNA-splicing factor SLU7 n=4 Tax=Rhizophagus irregularis TaxID=588596 RepID=A0A2I1EDJ0_9GLOM|nr:pre-mRNA-splicing factor SLU7 [Rhizophagus irregularis DAOM 181602=DAOM 197198]EXX72126.1 Slu7p [Rhizophagus irregularis DAOM 197198w]PKC11826.1 pre-mRNA-splicing factor SLU7 [Rhizophagus irregularis]PKK71433.1 pre-mRNA-splicing factor SLU7 [Rhizophagus irregularis]PKY20167.1 pre-mRNA-splicing factor SLU7 [Rhizophagus irregularis]POG69804.1 pre-mRNA-splicing factor SLU7 [Rhizophagus irregularis DAOM 181602=DAOM 197198]|eukprot:XP_025176670.1 pre-mRNA-splicing factor SLU7 [Rhizophagus irregularis DAOM 181602=DAOM 197198]
MSSISFTSSNKLSREDYRRQKDLEAARKAGTAPAEQDEEGKDINPHIPQYIAKAPWYLDTGRPSLKHQRVQEKEEQIINDKWYARGIRAGPAATKFRKGACENCGAMTHKTKDCMDRPRKTGAKWSGKDIKADEIIQEIELDYDSKRDRWNGYDPSEHAKIYDEYEKIEEARRKMKASELDKQSTTELVKKTGERTAGEFSSEDEEDDEDKYAERSDMPGQKVNTKTRTTIRNLRIREDTAKYLRNLDIDSAYYDPKTRSMRDNPNKEVDESEAYYTGDNFVRYTGDAPKMANLQLFAWQAYDKGTDVHLQANPTQGELLHREYLQKKDKLKDTSKDSILAKYGGEEHLDAPPKELLLAQTESYVEYSRTGRVIKGQERAKAKSKYEEDVYINNHVSVWGSYWADGQWGYKCCHSFIKNSYCTGLIVIEVINSSNPLASSSIISTGNEELSSAKKTLVELHNENMKKSKSKNMDEDVNKHLKRKDLGEGEIKLDSKKLKKALENEENRYKLKNNEVEIDDRKRPYNSAYMGKNNSMEAEVTEEDLEAYRLKKQSHEDPMANYVDEDDL